ncbi:acyl carrier protein [Paenibacillus athensensis]|uniref:Carrier domain-containing protein n=1 Tax=Paenibacillus athensensis TaxID=1967502 RepID=A0A4Y8Q9F6_9BACL|nr:acyl carrier protein [Paenibacillus athensensis]MCD1257289.1 acyl carrier protein [Paenibacillus athensensis]
MAEKTLATEEIAKIIKEVFIKETRSTLTVDEMTDDLKFTPDGFRIDSLTFIRSVIALEDALDIQVGDNVLMQSKFANVGELVQYIAEICQAQGRG